MEKLITFDQLKVGQSAKVVKINTTNSALKRRIMDMGIVKGVCIKVIKVAPLGDPVQVELRGYMLSLRKVDLELISGEILTKKQVNDLQK